MGRLPMQKQLPISVCMISGPEANRISNALASVTPWVSEIIVVLNEHVNDGTEELARQHGAQVFREPWRGYVAQKNSAAQKATQDWVLGLDADEVVSAELRQEIQAHFSAAEPGEAFAAFSFPRLTMFCGRWIRHGDWYPDRGTRLWRRGLAEWGGTDPHAKLVVQGAIGRLESNLLHYNAASIDDQIAKISASSNDFLRDALRRNRPGRWLALALPPSWRFLRSYVFRLGFLDGWQGYYIAWITAFYTATRYAKLLAAAQTEDPNSRKNV